MLRRFASPTRPMTGNCCWTTSILRRTRNLPNRHLRVRCPNRWRVLRRPRELSLPRPAIRRRLRDAVRRGVGPTSERPCASLDSLPCAVPTLPPLASGNSPERLENWYHSRRPSVIATGDICIGNCHDVIRIADAPRAQSFSSGTYALCFPEPVAPSPLGKHVDAFRLRQRAPRSYGLTGCLLRIDTRLNALMAVATQTTAESSSS
ncbi:MAG: hypothetical protein QOF47_1380, partial [Mycobacterium sp.]|nr:hypothetical protein [Mycobacterium sp.]